jgi:hypothetical protein
VWRCTDGDQTSSLPFFLLCIVYYTQTKTSMYLLLPFYMHIIRMCCNNENFHTRKWTFNETIVKKKIDFAVSNFFCPLKQIWHCSCTKYESGEIDICNVWTLIMSIEFVHKNTSLTALEKAKRKTISGFLGNDDHYDPKWSFVIVLTVTFGFRRHLSETCTMSRLGKLWFCRAQSSTVSYLSFFFSVLSRNNRKFLPKLNTLPIQKFDNDNNIFTLFLQF